MATDLMARVFCGIVCEYATDGEAEIVQAVFSQFGPTLFTFGTGSGKANMFWSDERTIGASSDHTLDLRGSLTNKLGETAAFSLIKAIYIKASADNAGPFGVGDAASNQWVGFLGGATHQLLMYPDASFCYDWGSGFSAITNATNDNLMFGNSLGSSVAYTIAILGESA